MGTEKERVYKSQLYQTRKLNGYCVQCGTVLTNKENKTIRCDVCRISCNEYGRANNHKRYKAKAIVGKFLSRVNISDKEMDFGIFGFIFQFVY